MTTDLYATTDFYGMPVSRTNRTRIVTARKWLRRAKAVALLVVSILGLLAFNRACINPPSIDVEAITQRTNNEHDQIGEFVADFVEHWLTSTSSDAQALSQFIDMKVAGPPPPRETAAAAVAKASKVAVNYQGGNGVVDEFSATATVMERQIPSSPPRRTFYRMPVIMWKQQPIIVGWPEPVNGPGPGVHVKLGYPVPLDQGPVFELVGNFVTTYLTKTSGLNQYAVAGSGIWPVGGYSSAHVASLQLSEQLPEQPANGQTIRALAQVIARTTQQVPLPITMVLSLENNNGTWMISRLDLAPVLADTDPEPIKPGK